jgi:hypothetical protein
LLLLWLFVGDFSGWRRVYEWVILLLKTPVD